MKIAISNHFYAGTELSVDKLKTIKSLGFEYIEFWTMPPHINLNDEKNIDESLRLVSNSGLIINSYHAPIFKLRDDASSREISYITEIDEKERLRSVDLICRSIEVMSKSGSNLIVLHGDMKDKKRLKETKESLKKSLKEICERAKKHNTLVALENTERELPVAELKRIVDELSIENLGLCIDVGHANVFENPVEAIRTAGNYLLNIHASDNDGISDSHLHPGSGNVEWNQIAETLSQMNYQGSFTIEVKSANGIEGISLSDIKRLLKMV
ncbi:MAG: sugar phosphate isomerase/epimerase [Candidatus Schekmanbacteria bacterium]|nr:MAG: sugar phosphate isomerase/epimerase [Candidatus Schekmanbacteria bacterium]